MIVPGFLRFSPPTGSWQVLGLLFLIGSLPILCRAQAPSDTSAARDTSALKQVQMTPVEVTSAPFQIFGDRTSFSVSARTRADASLNSTPSLSLEEISSGLPGLSVQSRTHFALGDRITIRGLGWRAQFGVRGIQMTLDGIPLTVADGQSVVHLVDPSFIRSVEVIRGPASTFWGNASGGVLALSTRPNEPDHTVRFKQTTGSYGLSKTDVQVTPDVGPHSVSAYASYLTQDGFREHSDTRLFRAGMTGDLALGRDRGLRIVGAVQHMPRADSPGSLQQDAARNDPQQARQTILEFDVGKDVQQGQLGVTYYDETKIGRLNATAYGILRDLENPIPFDYIDLNRKAGGLRFTLEDSGSRVDWGLGVEGKLQSDDRTEFDNDGGTPTDVNLDQRETVDNAAVFGRVTVPFGRLQIDAGLRYDRLHFEADDRLGSDDGSQTFQKVSPSVGVSYRLGTARVFANVSTGLETPTTTELSNRPDGRGGFNDLDAENILGVEGGVTGHWIDGRLSYDLALFYQDVDDVLVPFQLRDFGPTFFRNEGAARHRGSEIAVEWQPVSRLSVRGSYTYTDAEFTDGTIESPNSATPLDGNKLPGVPAHKVDATVTIQTAFASGSVSVQSLSEQYGDSENTTTNDGHRTVDFRVSHPGFSLSKNTSLIPFFGVNNAFDARYNDVVVNAFGGRFFEPAAGRHYRVGASLQIE